MCSGSVSGFCYINNFILYCKIRDIECPNVLSVGARNRHRAQGFVILKIVIKDLNGKLNNRNLLRLLLAESCEISSIRKAPAIVRHAASAPIKSFNCAHYIYKEANPTAGKRYSGWLHWWSCTADGRFSNSRDKLDGTSSHGFITEKHNMMRRIR